MMTKVYLVTEGEYSEYNVRGAFSTEEKAKEALALTVYGQIEAFDLDAMPTHPPGTKLFSVHIDEDGAFGHAYQNSASLQGENPEWSAPHSGQRRDGWSFTLWAKDKDHAIKIASERRFQMLASGEWGMAWEEWRQKRI